MESPQHTPHIRWGCSQRVRNILGIILCDRRTVQGIGMARITNILTEWFETTLAAGWLVGGGGDEGGDE